MPEQIKIGQKPMRCHELDAMGVVLDDTAAGTKWRLQCLYYTHGSFNGVKQAGT